jgi:hypothetical protein
VNQHLTGSMTDPVFKTLFETLPGGLAANKWRSNVATDTCSPPLYIHGSFSIHVYTTIFFKISSFFNKKYHP